MDHMFFPCVIAKFLWSGVHSMFAVNWNPSNRQDWFFILSGFNEKTRSFLCIFLAVQCWSRWTTRNKFSIEANYLANLLIAFSKFCLTCYHQNPPPALTHITREVNDGSLWVWGTTSLCWCRWPRRRTRGRWPSRA
jgi:hypothetical protein